VSLPAPGGSWLRLRVIGVALSAFGVALVAIGVVVGGFGSGSPATASSTSAVATETATPASRSTTSSPPTVATVSSVVMTTTSEPSTTPVPTTAPVSPATIAPTATVDNSPSDVSVRVFNNSTIHGLSEKAAGELRAKGWNVVEVGNFTGRFPTTTVYYQPGTGEQAEATKLAASIGATTAPRIEEITSFAPGLIVVVTSDFSG
jgi:hypothetical protein